MNRILLALALALCLTGCYRSVSVSDSPDTNTDTNISIYRTYKARPERVLSLKKPKNCPTKLVVKVEQDDIY